jgi:hypothetical protein
MCASGSGENGQSIESDHFGVQKPYPRYGNGVRPQQGGEHAKNEQTK